VVVAAVAARAAAVAVAATAAGDVAAVAEPDLEPMAIAIGEAWASELVCSLRSVDREIVGAWPGTLREAHMRVRIALRSKLDVGVVEQLARVAYVAARRSWLVLSEPDPES
jgi:hypothetical protein